MDLGGEVAVERAEGDVGLLGDRAHLDGVETALLGERRWRRGSACAGRAGPLTRGRRSRASWWRRAPMPPRERVPTCRRVGPLARLPTWAIIGTRSSFALPGVSPHPPRPAPARRKRSRHADRDAVVPQQAPLGGQGIYIRRLSRELGHSVTRSRSSRGSLIPTSTRVCVLTKVPSLDLYRERRVPAPSPSEFRDLVDVEEFGTMCVAPSLSRTRSPSAWSSCCGPGATTSTSSSTTRPWRRDPRGRGLRTAPASTSPPPDHHGPRHRARARSRNPSVPEDRRWRWYSFLRSRGTAPRLAPGPHAVRVLQA